MERGKNVIHIQGNIWAWNAWNEDLIKRILSDGIWEGSSHLIMEDLHIKELAF